MTVCSPFMKSKLLLCYEFSPTAVPSIAAIGNIMSISFTWQWRISTTPKQRLTHRRQTESANVFIVRFKMSFIAWPFAKSSILALKSFRPTSITGREYNELRPHSGKYCFGKTPMQTFLDSKHLADEKQLDRLPVASLTDDLSPRPARAGFVP